jgi:putative membrane protein
MRHSALGCDTTRCRIANTHEPAPGVLKHVLIYGLFVLPLALGFLLPDTTMGSSLAAKKGMSFSSSDQLGSDAGSAPRNPVLEGGELDALFPADEYTAAYAKHAKELYVKQSVVVPEAYYIETLTTLDLYRDRLEGIRVEVSGFVYREDAMADSRFAVSRFAMNCCSADAMPYGMIVDFPNASRYADDEWVKVTGTMKLGRYNDHEVMTLQASAIERIEEPATPYVYPNFDFGLESAE